MAKKKTVTTNAMRILTAAKISFKAVEYEADEEKLKENTFGLHIAEATGIEPERSFKTLVGKGDKTGVTVFCIPVSCELDLKKAAAKTGNKRVELIHVKELLGLTGYIRGGVSPIGMKKQYVTVVDESALNCETIIFSAGKIGAQVEMSPKDLETVIPLTFQDIIHQ